MRSSAGSGCARSSLVARASSDSNRSLLSNSISCCIVIKLLTINNPSNFNSELAHSAIGNDLRSQQKRRVGTCEEEHSLGDLFGSPESFHRYLVPEIPRRLLERLGRQAESIEYWRGDGSGADGVDADATAHE